MNSFKSINTLFFNINDKNNFFSSISEIKKEIKLKNIIIELNEINFDEFLEDLNKLFIESKIHKRSFVIVKSDFKSDYYNLNIDIVPTLQEASDIIEIEEIERDLEI
ncbi:ribonuclease Z [Flavobacteriaceae bacterium]|nr:ribonuclease Z [Flavobacteriaceae bacterium]